MPSRPRWPALLSYAYGYGPQEKFKSRTLSPALKFVTMEYLNSVEFFVSIGFLLSIEVFGCLHFQILFEAESKDHALCNVLCIM